MTNARERYEAKTRVVTFRITRELYEELDEIRKEADLSFADLIKLGAGIAEEEIEKKLAEESKLKEQLADLRSAIRDEQQALDEFIDTARKKQLAKLEQQCQIYSLLDAGWNIDEVRFKLGIGRAEVSRHLKEWSELRGEREKLQTELLKKCLRNYILSLQENIQYRLVGRNLEEAKQRLEYCRRMLSDPAKLTEEEKTLLIAEYSYSL
jgi:hypothetical protein